MSDAFGTTPTETNDNPLADLVGEGKKYKTPVDLANAVRAKDEFIARLEAENAGMRNDLGSSDEVVAQLEALRQENLALKAKQNATQPRDQTGPALSDAEVEAIVAKAITKREAANTANQNINDANSRIVKAAGSVEKAQELVQTKARELGLSVDYLKQVAAQSPSAFERMVLDSTAKREVEVNTNSTRNTQAPVPTGDAKAGTKAYYDNLRRTNKKLYWSPAVQRQIIEATKNGSYQPE